MEGRGQEHTPGTAAEASPEPELAAAAAARAARAAQLTAQYAPVQAAPQQSHSPQGGEGGGGVGEEVAQPSSPRIVLLGLPSSGKSSIQRVVFQKLPPEETRHLPTTRVIERSAISNSDFVQFETWDCPGAAELGPGAEGLFVGCSTLVFVIDAQSQPYTAALDSLIRASELACQTNLHINFQVFIHKVDGLSDDQKIGTQRDIQGEVLDALDQRGLTNCHPSFHLTSIYDHSILEAFSKVVQTLIPQRGLLDSLLDLLISTCRIEKAFLFDLVSKIYIATDSEPYHMQSYELCAEMIDVVLETAAIYGVDGQGSGGSNGGSHDDQSFSVIKLSNGLVLCLREVDTHLGLVTMLREENFDRHGLLEFNFGILTQALSEAKRAPPSSQPT